MTLSSGSRLGAFEIQAPLGAGGMGEVWRARDSRLGRDVAIKALPETFAADPERLARFEREARLLASLSHPNVAGIHGLEEVGGRRYLVLEYVEGETLAQRLARGPLPVDEALDVCRQIAAAVEAAHEAGVIHRDLKPSNVKLTPAGEVKVLDFGLAKGTPAGDASSAPSLLSQSPTVALSMTGAGVILGTAAYMSPEQARGKPVDRRTDIWSFGCLLYECLTGRQLFEGETVSDLIARILEREPDWSALPAGTPSKVRDLLRRCLDKDAKRRMRDIGDARIELEEALAARAAATRSDPALAVAAPAATRQRRSTVTWTIVGALAGALASVFAARALTAWFPKSAPATPVRFSIGAPRGSTLTNDAMELAISPDGRTLAFVAIDSSGVSALWLRPLDAHAPRRLAGTDNGSLPFWSPDGRWIGFFADNKLKKVPAAGGNVETLAEANNGRGGTWNRDGAIVFGPAGAGPLFKIEREGDAPVAVTALDTTRNQTSHRYPQFLPDGRRFIYAAIPARQGRFEVFVGSLDGGPSKAIGSFDACPVYVEPGFLLFLRGQTVAAQRFDARSLRLEGDPVSLDEAPAPTQYSGAPALTASAAGVLVTLNGALPDTRIVRVDRSGARSAPLALPEGRYEAIDYSPDMRRIVVLRNDDRVTQDLWIFDLERGTLSRFTYGAGLKSNPLWSPDGRRIAYSSDREGPWDINLKAVGAGEETVVFQSPTPFKYPTRWSLDGRTLTAEALEQATGWDLWTISMDDSKPVPYLRTPFNERWGSISPDGRWLTYTSDESGKFEIYVQSYPNADEKHQVSTAGGAFSLWRRDGRELLFFGLDFQSVWSVEVRDGPGFVAGTPRRAFTLPPGSIGGAAAPDFSHLLIGLPVEGNAASSLDVLLHWDALASAKR